MKISVPLQFQEFAKSFGFSFDEICQRIGVTNTLWQEEIEVTPEQYRDFYVELGNALTDEQILALSNVQTMALFMPPVYAALSAGNGASAIERLQKYKRLIGPMKLETAEVPEGLEIRFHLEPDHLEMPRFGVLSEQTIVVSLLRQGTGRRIVPLSVKGPVAYSESWADFFGIKPEQADENILVIANEDLARPFLTENNHMWQFLEPTLTQKLDDLTVPSQLTDAVRKQLLTAIPSGEFTAADIAGKLGMSARTFQRKLAGENTTFKQLVKETQLFLAEGYLADASLTTDDVAFLVGYSEVSAFARAFKTWTGKTLTQYRAQ